MLRYSVTGDVNGEVVFFVNGVGVGSWMWESQISFFSKYKCITMDLPGHGENSDIDFTTIENCCKSIVRIIQKESHSRKVAMIGLSIGAQILLQMLENYEQLISRVVIISGLNKSMPIVKVLIKPMAICAMPLAKMRSYAKLQFKQLSIPDNMFELYYHDSKDLSAKTLCNLLQENTKFIFDNKSDVKVPALILVGEKEKRIMKKSAIKNQKLIKNSIGIVVQNAAHGIPYEQAELFNRIVAHFLADELVEACGITGVRELSE